MRCGHCDALLVAPDPRRRYCNARCRKAAGYQRREKDRRRAKYASDPEYRARIALQTAKYKAKDPARARRIVREWHARNDRSEYIAQWKAANPDKVRAYSLLDQHRRRSGQRLTSEVLFILKDPCSYCGGPGGELDHIVPLSKGGANDADNITAACRSCNAKKNARPLLIYLHEKAA